MEVYLGDGSGGFKPYNAAVEGGYYYVMTTPRNKALKVKQFLEENSIEAIVPMHYQDIMRRGKSSRELMTALDNSIYIKASLEQIRWIRKHLPYLTYVKEEDYSGNWKKYRVYIETEIVELFRLLERDYISDFLIVDSEDVSDDNFTQICTKSGVFKDIPLFFENVKGVDHKCLTMILNYGTVIAVKSLTPEFFMSQECEMVQTIDGEIKKSYFPMAKIAN